jgi:hypothetical protein
VTTKRMPKDKAKPKSAVVATRPPVMRPPKNPPPLPPRGGSAAVKAITARPPPEKLAKVAQTGKAVAAEKEFLPGATLEEKYREEDENSKESVAAAAAERRLRRTEETVKRQMQLEELSKKTQERRLKMMSDAQEALPSHQTKAGNPRMGIKEESEDHPQNGVAAAPAAAAAAPGGKVVGGKVVGGVGGGGTDSAGLGKQLLMREVAVDGSMDQSQLCIEKGFSVGRHVVNKTDVTIGATIVSYTNNAAKMKGDLDDKDFDVAIVDILGGIWIIREAKPQAEEVTWTSPSSSDEFKQMVIKAQITCALAMLGHRFDASNSKVTVFQKPKSVVANAPYAKGQLVLVPTTMKIECKVGDASAVPDKCVVVQLPKGAVDGVTYCLSPYTQMPNKNKSGFINPFFFVQTASNDDEDLLANMTLCIEKVEVENMGTICMLIMKNTTAILTGDSLRLPSDSKGKINAKLQPSPKKIAAKASAKKATDAPTRKRKKIDDSYWGREGAAWTSQIPAYKKRLMIPMPMVPMDS